MTIALALLTKEGIVLAADNGDYFEEENSLKETAQKIFAWPQQGIAFMHAGVAGRTVKGEHLEIRDQLEAFMRSMPINNVEPVRNTANSLFCFLYEQWRDALGDDPSDKIELLIAGYDKRAPACAILDIYHHLDRCERKYILKRDFEFFSLGGRKRMVDEILGLPNRWPDGLPRPFDIASALTVARFIILKVADREPSRISRKMQIAQIVGGRFAWIEPPPGMGSTSHMH
jgi:hypothetical protein